MADKKETEARRLAATLHDEEQAQSRKFEKADKLFARSQVPVAQTGKTSPATPGTTMVKNIFMMPAADHAIIQQIQDRFLGIRIVMNNSEIIRAALHKLLEVTDKEELRMLREKVTKIKRGRPS